MRCRGRSLQGRIGLLVLAGSLASCRGASQPEPSAGGGGAAGGDPASEARENERQAREDLAEPNKAEARAWLADPSHALFEGSREEVVAFVEDVYAQGAREVYVTGIETLGQTPVTASLVVVLPDDPAARGRVFQAIGAFLTRLGEDPLPDVGQKHVFIGLD